MIKKLALNLYYWPLFALGTTLAILLVPFARVFYFLVAGNNESPIFRGAIKIYGKILIRWVPFFAPVELNKTPALKNLPSPAIMVTNHCSAVDPYCFAVIPADIAFLTSWPFKIPVYNWFMKKARYMDSRLGWEHIRERGMELLEQGCSLLIWPEGHRSRDGRIGAFQNGAFRIACETGYPVVPIFISGTGKLLPPGSRLLSPARVTLTVLDACYPEKTSSNKKDVARLSDKVRDMLLNEQRKYEVSRG